MIKSNNLNNMGDDEISLKDTILKAKEWVYYLLSKWKLILIIFFIGGSIGFIRIKRQPILYNAELTYILEESNQSSNNNNLGLLAGQLGLSNPSSNMNSGMFSGSNLTEFMKSKALFEKVLLKPISINGETLTIAEYYIKIENLRPLWPKTQEYKTIKFEPNDNPENYSLNKTLIFNQIYSELISIDRLSFDKKEKKASFSFLSVKSKNEHFAKLFCEILINTTSEFYINKKTEKAKKNVDKLQAQVDSVRLLFSNSVSEFASASDKIYNLNPALKSKGVLPIKKQVDVQANTTLLSTLISNLEMAKYNLNNETPLFQIIDKPRYPLEKNTPDPIKYFLLYGSLAGLLSIIFLVLHNLYKKMTT